ncbi:hypothetical protein PG335_10880 [Riemerella anatipestifer]|nr:hypothetical protein [Riemerella anatipestifer]
MFFSFHNAQRVEDNTLNIRVYAEQQPHETFEEVKPMLEDVYFVSLKNDQ